MEYQRKGPEDFTFGDRVRLHVSPLCEAGGSAHGYVHNLINQITGTVSWTQYPHGRFPDHVWKVDYDSGHFGWHRPDELRDLVDQVITKAL